MSITTGQSSCCYWWLPVPQLHVSDRDLKFERHTVAPCVALEYLHCPALTACGLTSLEMSLQVQRVPSAKLSAQPPPLGALTPSQVNARASSPALTSTSPLKGSPPKVGEKPRADLKDAERHLLDE